MLRGLIVAVVLATLLAACSDFGRDPGIRIINTTDAPVEVTYEEPGEEEDLGTIQPGGLLVDHSVVNARSGCAGPFVARTPQGDEIARLEKACTGTEWRITEPVAS